MFPNNIIHFLTSNTKKISLIFIIFAITLVWSYVFGFFHNSDWNIPTGYGGDLFWVLSMAKSYMNNDIIPFFYKEIKTLNAPFSANWSDFPITEEFIFLLMGYIGKFSNLFFSHNIVLLLGHILAGISFYIVAIYFKCKNFNALTFGIIFGLSHFLFLRGSAHIILTYVFLIPVAIFILDQTLENQIQIRSKKFTFFVLISFLIGCFNPYYTFMYCTFLLFIFIYNFLKKKNNFHISIFYILASSLGFFLMNMDTFYSNFVNGPNLKAVGRNLAALEVYGMKMPEFFLPPSGHRLEFFSNFAMSNYYHRTFVRGESWSSYIGIIGAIGILTLISNSIVSIRKGWNNLEIRSLLAINWIFLYSLIGGINLILGVLNFQIFRAPNRFSIYIYCIILLYLCIKTSKIKNFLLRNIIILFIFFVGLFDNLPRINLMFQEPIKKIVQSDIKMGETLMNSLKKNEMVYQFPYMEFPEVGPINKMGDYEHLRAFINTRDIHFTYGNNKGRGIEEWQSKIELDDKGKFIDEIESYGFSAIYINKKAYENEKINNIKEVFKIKDKKLLFEGNDILIYKIKKYRSPKKIAHSTIYDYRWSQDEVTHRWAKRSNAKITFFGCCENDEQFLSFKLNSVDIGKYEIYINKKFVLSGQFSEVGKYIDIKISKDFILPAKNELLIKTNIKRQIAGNGDNRLITFSIKDFIN